MIIFIYVLIHFNTMDIKKDIEAIERFINQRDYPETIDRCYKLIGMILTDYFNKIFPSMNLSKQEEIINELKTEFESKKFSDLYYSAKIRIFIKHKLFSKTKLKFTTKTLLEKYKDKNIKISYTIRVNILNSIDEK